LIGQEGEETQRSAKKKRDLTSKIVLGMNWLERGKGEEREVYKGTKLKGTRLPKQWTGRKQEREVTVVFATVWVEYRSSKSKEKEGGPSRQGKIVSANDRKKRNR